MFVCPSSLAIPKINRDYRPRYRRDVGDTLINAYVLIQRLDVCFKVIKFRYYVLRDDMLGYYLSDLTTLLQNKKEGEGWEVGTINLIHADDEILCCDRRLRQRFIASRLSKKPFRLSLISTCHSFLVPTSSVGYRHPATIACSVLCWGLSVYFNPTLAFPVFTQLVKRFLRLVVHNPPCRIKRTPACRSGLRGARAERCKPVFACSKRPA
jgi:hypothetical protein